MGDKPDFAISDSGLSDNFGVAGAYLTMKQATHDFEDLLPKEVLWIEIRLKDSDTDKSDRLAGLAVGSVLALVNVRGTAQRSLAEQLVELAKLSPRAN